MKRHVGRLIFGLMGVIAAAGIGLGAQDALTPQSPDWPHWAYGHLRPLAPGDRVAPPCPPTAMPMDCAYIGPPEPDDGIERSLPGTDLTFTRNEVYANFAPADWYPGDHPPMPDLIAHGKPEEGVRACALCHYPNGQGKMENGGLAGLPAAYILQQIEAFRSGNRRSADPRKANTNEMVMIAKSLTDAEAKLAADYFSSMNWRPWVRVVESEEAPQVTATANGLFSPVEDAPFMPLGQRIVEVSEDPDGTLITRNPRTGFVAYVPIGSVAKGEALAAKAGCGICHGADLKGVGNVPGIAGRTAGYTMRQLWDMKQGTRKNQLMAPVVATLSAEDLMNITAYVASQEP